MKLNKTIVIIGGSAGSDICSEILSVQYKRILFLETYSQRISENRIIGKKIKDGISFLSKKNVDYFIATGDNDQRKENFEYIYKKTGKTPINCIHPSAYISLSAKIGNGNLICPHAVIHTEAVIGNNTIINTSSVVEHDCVIDDYAQISPNTTLCGRDEIGEGAFIGAGSVIVPKIKIGKKSVIAAGSSVITNVPANTLYAGVPAVFKKKI